MQAFRFFLLKKKARLHFALHRDNLPFFFLEDFFGDDLGFFFFALAEDEDLLDVRSFADAGLLLRVRGPASGSMAM